MILVRQRRQTPFGGHHRKDVRHVVPEATARQRLRADIIQDVVAAQVGMGDFYHRAAVHAIPDFELVANGVGKRHVVLGAGLDRA